MATTLSALCGIEFKLVKATQAGNIFADSNRNVLLLKAVNRDYRGTIKKPIYYLNKLEKGRSEYLTGLFATNDETVFSGDYKDSLGLKHLVKVCFADGGKLLKVTA
jgi:hypothetical protein